MFILIRRLVGSLAQLRGDIDRERKGADDLRREIQSYVNHVRQVESILARKVRQYSLVYNFIKFINV